MSTDQSDSPDLSSVRVAVRIRPQSARERIEFCRVCTTVTPGEPQLLLGNDRAFTFDFVFNSDSTQDTVFDSCAKPLILSCLEGYNSTIFAYGQTGSGKTYSMGTGFEVDQRQCDIGIIPRSVDLLFSLIHERRAAALSAGIPVPEFQVSAQYLELYNEEIYDLFAPDRDVYSKRGKSAIKIHESGKGEIFCESVTTRPVNSLADTLECLRLGSLGRATASTNMNAQSSRSHAVFTIYIRQQRAIVTTNSGSTENLNGVVSGSDSASNSSPSSSSANSDGMAVSATNVPAANNGIETPEFEVLTAKFHFVDLAGSERLKRTGATGERAREGISINCGLLALGNVISALGDTSRHCSHVPYRDSKLTRILQDSLGGNSRTVMVACISPSDCDFVETLNTLKYANRARNIKNKITVNQDKTSAVISALRAEIIQLKQELLEFKQGKRYVDGDGSEQQNDVDKENTLLLRDNDLLRRRIHALQETIDQLTESKASIMASFEAQKLKQIIGSATTDSAAEQDGNGDGDENSTEAVILRYARDNEKLRAQLQEYQALCKQLTQRAGSQRSAQNTPRPFSAAMPLLSSSFISPGPANLIATPNSANAPMNGLKSAGQQDGGVYASNAIVEDDPENEDLLEEARAKLVELRQLQKMAMQSSGGSDVVNGNNGLDSSVVESTDDEAGGTLIANSSQVQQDEELNSEINDIQDQINIQQQLIERLERSQVQMAMMRQQYEAKVGQLQTKIRETEAERDRVLNNVERTEASSKGKSDQLRLEYESRIQSLQVELKKVQAASRDYARTQAKQAENERKLEQLRAELASMKQAKTGLVRRLRDESLKQRKAEAEKNREIANLRRQQQQKDSMIQRLEAEKVRREMVVKRQQEETEALRRRQHDRQRRAATAAANRPASNRTHLTASNATITLSGSADLAPSFSAEECEQVWQGFIHRLNHLVAGRSLLNRADCELKRLLGEREALKQRLQRYLRQRGHISSSPLPRPSDDIIADLEAQIDNLKANVRYNEDSIEECQRRIIQLVSPPDSAEQATHDESCDEQTAGSGLFDGEVDIKRILTGSGGRPNAVTKSSDAMGFVLEKLMNAFISQGVTLARLEGSSNNGSEKADVESERSSKTEPRLRRYPGVNSVALEGELVPTNGKEDGFDEITTTPVKSNGFAPPLHDDASQVTPKASLTNAESGGLLAVSNRSAKARRWSATTQELLFGRTPNMPKESTIANGNPAANATITAGELAGNAHLAPLVEAESEVSTNDSKINSSKNESIRIVEPLPNPSSLPPVPTRSEAPGSPGTQPKLSGGNDDSDGDVFRRLTRGSRRGIVDESCEPVASLSHLPGKIRASNSFVLNNSSTSFSSSSLGPNNSQRNSGSPSPKCSSFDTNAPVVEYVGQASGHLRSVLCVAGDSQGILFSGSKDRTVKAWDLLENRELFTLNGHPDSVVRVLYSQQSKLLFTVAGSCIRVWDCRCFRTPVAQVENPKDDCVIYQTLLSSGLQMEGAGSRGEILRMGRSDYITDAALLSTPGTELLMSSANSDVRIWDLRNFNSTGKLISPGGGLSAVMSVCTSSPPNRYVFTGSRDHLVRYYDLNNGVLTGTITPRLIFGPPHYDSVISLAFTPSCQGRMLAFSGSRDGCLRRWEWSPETACSPQDVHFSAQNNAHRAGITGLAVIPWLVDSDYQDQLLVSAGRDSALRIWSTNPDVPLTPLAEVTNAHSQAIQCVSGANTDNGVFVYTGSNDRRIRIWRLATKEVN